MYISQLGVSAEQVVIQCGGKGEWVLQMEDNELTKNKMYYDNEIPKQLQHFGYGAGHCILTIPFRLPGLDLVVYTI